MDIQAKIHRRSVDEMVALGKKCKALRAYGIGMNEVCERFGVSARTVTVWMERAKDAGRRRSG